MKLAIACMRKGQPRFFAGRYDHSRDGMPCPVTTGRPDLARSYDERGVAQLLVNFFNVLDGIEERKPSRNWSVIDLPEAWTS